MNKKSAIVLSGILLTTVLLPVIVFLSRSQKGFISKAHAQTIVQAQTDDSILSILHRILVSLVRANSPMVMADKYVYLITSDVSDSQLSVRNRDFPTGQKRAEAVSDLITEATPYFTSN